MPSSRLGPIVVACLGLLAGCPPADGPTGSDDVEAPDVGSVLVCLPFGAGDDTLVEVDGTVVGIDDGSTDCVRSLTVSVDDGSVVSVGWSVSDADGGDLGPSLDLEAGDPVHLGMRAHLVFGEVRGLLITDDEGLLLAADEGTWGGGLEEDETGLRVEPGTVVATVEAECTITDYSVVRFTDAATGSSVEVWPLESDGLTVREQALTVQAVASIQRSSGRSCSVSDQTDVVSWVAWR